MQIPLASRVRNVQPSLTLQLSARARALREAGRDVISFTAGELDVGPPEAALDEAAAALERGETRYTPAAGTPALRAEVARRTSEETGVALEPGHVIVCCGAKHALYNVVQALCEPGDEVVIPAPYWLSYPAMVKLAGATPVVAPTRPEHGYRLEPDALAAAIGPRTRLLVLNTPNNPTGAVYERERLEAIAQIVRAHPRLFVLTDEIYGKLTYGEAHHVPLWRVAPDLFERSVLVDGVSKSYAMTGFRIGWAVGPAPVIAACTRLQSHATSGPCSISQAAALAALRCRDEPIEPVRALLEQRRARMVAALERIPGFELVPPRGAFYCFPRVGAWLGRTIDGRRIESALTLCEILLEQAGIALVPGDPFGAPDHVRLSFALGTDAMQRGLERLHAFLAEHAEGGD
ncbi:MAG: pyridoxal phosphate-dependent aminotransferase [Planctomycetota bacterium]|nr:MAG: pyridoxal phosphate-dependent aminotransferase [Planctomycetota bacterium]